MLPPGFDAGNFLIHHLNEYSPSHTTPQPHKSYSQISSSPDSQFGNGGFFDNSPQLLKVLQNIEISCERGRRKRHEERIPSGGTTPQPPL